MAIALRSRVKYFVATCNRRCGIAKENSLFVCLVFTEYFRKQNQISVKFSSESGFVSNFNFHIYTIWKEMFITGISNSTLDL